MKLLLRSAKNRPTQDTERTSFFPLPPSVGGLLVSQSFFEKMIFVFFLSTNLP